MPTERKHTGAECAQNGEFERAWMEAEWQQDMNNGRMSRDEYLRRIAESAAEAARSLKFWRERQGS